MLKIRRVRSACTNLADAWRCQSYQWYQLICRKFYLKDSFAFIFQERRFREEMRRAKREETNSGTVVHVNPSPPNILHGCYNVPGTQYHRITLIFGMVTVYKVHILLSSFFALSTYLYTHRQTALFVLFFTPSQNVRLWRVFWRQGVTFHSFKGAKETKRGRRSPQGPGTWNGSLFSWIASCIGI